MMQRPCICMLTLNAAEYVPAELYSTWQRMELHGRLGVGYGRWTKFDMVRDEMSRIQDEFLFT